MSVLDEISAWPVDSAAAVVVTADDEIARYGDVDEEFALASVTKLLVAEAVLIAVEEEAIALDQPAGPPGATVRHLLAHASGLAFDSDEVQAGVAEERIYSSRGYEILAELVERETGIAFADYLDEAVCAPLSMTSTSLWGPAGHGATSTAGDLAVFAREYLAPRLLSAAQHDQATRVQYPGLDGFVPGYGKHRPNDWGLGPEIRGEKSPHWTGSNNSPQTYGHFGQSGTYLWVDPDLGAACVVLTDRAFGGWAKPRWADFNVAVVDEVAAHR
ncbi:serine hydrolase domain-containing protein [Williamsia sterculiae]|uniref:CubicO group peptidase, beta-lactamase class C family n=1 Tax=Williamsia sterculiae TaxID=1344003 RepID=A0A1N7G865_9NOCA|nr:serine hydrolase domain-containing protein [Williamsia sterculiae]SIS08789.1 CubicO group peptidase, beta-lactamase class C family [Williamsia sterculiae]